LSPRRKAAPSGEAGPAGDQAALAAGDVSPEEYAAFIQQIDLISLWLVSARVENREGPTPPPELSVDIAAEYRFEQRAGGFDAFASYRATFGHGEEPDAASYAEVTFGLRFTSAQPMTEALFRTFADVNLPVNAWPFLREFLQSATARMGWPALTIPTFKVGTGGSRPTRPRRARSAPRPERQVEEPSDQPG
jgi:hypothetical protein